MTLAVALALAGAAAEAAESAAVALAVALALAGSAADVAHVVGFLGEWLVGFLVAWWGVGKRPARVKHPVLREDFRSFNSRLSDALRDSERRVAKRQNPGKSHQHTQPNISGGKKLRHTLFLSKRIFVSKKVITTT